MARGSSPTLIGRTDDLERLRAAVAGARTHERPVVLVSGEAGIGKSRLLAEYDATATPRHRLAQLDDDDVARRTQIGSEMAPALRSPARAEAAR